MAIASNDETSLYDGLIYKFLYKNDINCIHILLNLYDLEENITNIYPKYISLSHLKKQISRGLSDKKGNHFISLNLGQLIHEDINRLELFLYLQGYKHGYFNNYWVNVLEKISIKELGLDNLCKDKYLYHFDNKNQQINHIKLLINEELKENKKGNSDLHDLIKDFCSSILKKKVFNLNKYLDKQLSMESSSRTYNFTEEDNILTLEELNIIYKEIIKIVMKDGLKLYKEAFWYGLNDRVLKRYR